MVHYGISDTSTCERIIYYLDKVMVIVLCLRPTKISMHYYTVPNIHTAHNVLPQMMDETISDTIHGDSSQTSLFTQLV